jgi:pyridoxamine 5'-phosphate oxidase-like protein
VTAGLPPEVREAFERFITCEYATIDRAGQPIIWPVTPYDREAAGTVDITTGLGYPKKANDARSNPKVALLFSDPTGSGITSGLEVLVQGTADVDDRDLAANRERYWRESWEKLPGTRKLHPPKAIRGMLGWYYTRIYVHVRPERVFVWPTGDVNQAPDCHDAHLEEVRSGHNEEPIRSPEPPAGGAIPWDQRIEELGRRYETAVLSWTAPDGFPLAARLPVAADRAQRSIVFGTVPAGLPLIEGRACVTAHRHNPDFSWQENFQVRGDLVHADDRIALVPRKLVGGFELPDEGRLAALRRNFSKSVRFHRTARRELRARRARAAL